MIKVQWKGSPNYDKNRKKIDTLVLHWFGVGTLTSANSRFQNKSSKVSAHYGISNDIVYQWVKEEHVAYHAGDYAMNQKSIGIEHSATTERMASESTYKTSAELIARLCKQYNIPCDRKHIIGHKEVKPTACPGTIDINKLIVMATAIINPMNPSEEKAMENLKAYRKVRKQGAESNLEGFVNAIIGSDRDIYKMLNNIKKEILQEEVNVQIKETSVRGRLSRKELESAVRGAIIASVGAFIAYIVKVLFDVDIEANSLIAGGVGSNIINFARLLYKKE